MKFIYKDFEFILVNVYVPPNASSYYKSDYWVHLERLLEEIITLHIRAIIILVGDFNTKLGQSLHDFAW